MSRLVAVGFVLALLLVATVGTVGAGTVGATASSDADGRLGQQQFDSTKYHITVFENGSARWTFSYSQPLNNESETRQFRDFAANFNNDSTELYTDFQGRAGTLVQQGSNVTGRQMGATEFSKKAYVDDEFGKRGVVKMSFTWSKFAAVDGDRVEVGDVFDGGLYVGPKQSLVIEHGPNLGFQSYDPDPDSSGSDSLTWNGEREFADERPQAVLVPADQAPDSPDQSPDSPTGPSQGGIGLLAFLALAVFIVLGGAAVVAYRSGALDGAVPSLGDDGESDGGAAPPATGAEPAITDEDLLSDEDRVLELLREQGGRMKQVNIVEETGWSKSKVSMLLSDMEEDGDISKLRVGRENIVSLAGQEPEAAGSPFDDGDEGQ